MNKKCRTCTHHENDSSKLNTGRKVIAGNYCSRFNWNLDNVKTWTMKVDRCEICGIQLSRVRLAMHYPAVHGIKYPGTKGMNQIPGDCYE